MYKAISQQQSPTFLIYFWSNNYYLILLKKLRFEEAYDGPRPYGKEGSALSLRLNHWLYVFLALCLWQAT